MSYGAGVVSDFISAIHNNLIVYPCELATVCTTVARFRKYAVRLAKSLLWDYSQIYEEYCKMRHRCAGARRRLRREIEIG